MNESFGRYIEWITQAGDKKFLSIFIICKEIYINRLNYSPVGLRFERTKLDAGLVKKNAYRYTMYTYVSFFNLCQKK